MQDLIGELFEQGSDPSKQTKIAPAQTSPIKLNGPRRRCFSETNGFLDDTIQYKNN